MLRSGLDSGSLEKSSSWCSRANWRRFPNTTKTPCDQRFAICDRTGIYWIFFAFYPFRLPGRRRKEKKRVKKVWGSQVLWVHISLPWITLHGLWLSGIFGMTSGITWIGKGTGSRQGSHPVAVFFPEPPSPLLDQCLNRQRNHADSLLIVIGTISPKSPEGERTPTQLSQTERGEKPTKKISLFQQSSEAKEREGV